MTAPNPLSRAPLAKRAAASGVRWALRMWASQGISNSSSWAQAALTTGQSESEPSMTATFFTAITPFLWRCDCSEHLIFYPIPSIHAIDKSDSFFQVPPQALWPHCYFEKVENSPAGCYDNSHSISIRG